MERQPAPAGRVGMDSHSELDRARPVFDAGEPSLWICYWQYITIQKLALITGGEDFALDGDAAV
jgi:hypothetical protein